MYGHHQKPNKIVHENAFAFPCVPMIAQPKFLLMKTFLRADDNNREFALAQGNLVNLFRPPYCASDPVRLWRDDIFDSFVGLWVSGLVGGWVLGARFWGWL